ncbi:MULTISPECIES: alpha/beta fold hydrolase [Arthrobacter]|uniref:Alpha/beta hydrolase n=1 Tax=Arthrobacter terricola TaxID=2547396 RepID=A0A4R5KRR7_9MICC|nr:MULTISPECIES: alpha/beta hydrolase [Arthrobacter]MBT8160430.1 alpha/beta hydrolase [Arthrobacter sp. GN70]TDF98523.1 alpha/beta hydrolase [Arthrobacter terricola]
METWTVETDDDGGLLEVHSFGNAGGAAFPGAPRATSGPGVVLVHGTLVTDSLYWQFARHLSALLGRPVHTYNRRGRGGSAPQPSDYSAETEINDLTAVMKASESTEVVGHSFGGFVALQTARLGAISRLVTYDAAVSFSGSLNGRWRPELEESLTAGQLDQAWAHLVQGLGTAGPISYLPLGALRLLSILSAKTRLGYEMRGLLPAAVLEMHAVLDAESSVEDFADLDTPTLMLSGGWSPAYFAAIARQVAAVAPAVESGVVPFHFHDGPIRPGKLLAERTAKYLAA